jgi:hypothetical protein
MNAIRTFLGLEAVAFAAAALVHARILLDGYQHRQASVAESVIGLVLIGALFVSVAIPRVTRAAGLAAQAFALLGTLVGITMIAIGVGPQTSLDVVLHAGFVALLVAGLVVAKRSTIGRTDTRHIGTSHARA